MIEKEILDVEEALELFRTSRQTFYRWLKSGKLRGFKAGKQWRFYRDDLVTFMESAGTEFVALKNEFNEAIHFFEEKLRKKNVNL
jgi:excisionase family DNA binding protein